MSKATETLQFLANYNSWRRGDEALEMPAPAEIGAVIDDAVNLLRKYDRLERMEETVGYKQEVISQLVREYLMWDGRHAQHADVIRAFEAWARTRMCVT